MHNLLLLLSLYATTSVGIPVSSGVPEPSIAPTSWELNFRYHDPQRVSVVLPGEKTPVVYWFMLYTVENSSDREVDFYPRFELVTDTLQVVPSEIKVSPEAFKAIQRRAGDRMLVPPEQAIGRLLRGEDRKRHSVAIWRNLDPKARSFTVYVAGLSGEMARMKNPVFDAGKPESDTNKRYFILRKTLSIPYKLPGGQSVREMAVPERMLGDEKWIMR